MNEFLTNMFGDLTELPWWGWLVVAVLLIGGALAFKWVRGSQKVVWNARMLAVGAMCIALSSVLSNIKLFSMIMLFAFVYGPMPGIMVGFVHGVLQFLMGGWFLNIWQMLLEYPIAFAVLGLAGLCWKMKNQQLGMLIGVVIACLARWFCSTLAGVVFWGDFTNGTWAAIAYSVTYNASYMVWECVICGALGLLMGKRLVTELRKVK